MSDKDSGVETQVDETTTPAAPQEEKNTEDLKQEGEPVEKTKGTSEAKIDYEKMLEEERARRERAEKKVVDLKREKKDNKDVDLDDVESKLAELVEQRIGKLTEEVQSKMMKGEVDAVLNEISSDPAERELIRMYYDDRIVKTGYSPAQIRENLTDAKILVNKQTFLSHTKELSEALKSKATMSEGANFSSASRETNPTEPKLTDAERKLLEKFGALESYKKKFN